ncbi:galactolipase DONGLE, chloroplastic-like [Lotus japonicus]|uniref:galactolipase DONGLE, chloroplastic-like n=1 Tax=Lotus japonicus TaxID=34305 RepID=UPI00258F2E14|nr:galactolipase DONGLE, chloroplastic-like [Lotus japonicus]
MASSATHLPNTNPHITFSQSFRPIKSHPFGQVSLPNRNNDLSPSKHSIVASGSALGITSTLAITLTNNNTTLSQPPVRQVQPAVIVNQPWLPGNQGFGNHANQLNVGDPRKHAPPLQGRQVQPAVDVANQPWLPGNQEPWLPGNQGLVNEANQPNAEDARKHALPPSTTCLAKLWREIQGCNNWENLLDPLHPLLRQEIIRYGEFVSASYKAFDLDPTSKRYLNCKYGKKNMLSEVGMENSGYEVTKYIYATPDINIPITNSSSINSGRWVGYVAVSSDEAVKRLGRRDIVVTFRGTVTNQEWISNLMSSLTPAMLDPHNPQPHVKVESGFLSLYTSDESSSKFGLQSCREQLLCEVSRLMKKHKGERVSISLAGHSMGSALAILLAYDIAELGLNKKNPNSTETVSVMNQLSQTVPITVFSFGGPRVGNSEFKERCEELGVKVLRIANVNDPITKLPGVFMNENFRVLGGRYEFPWSCSCYAHVGVELVLDFFNVQNPSCVHDLDSYIGLLRCPNSKNKVEVMMQSQREGVNFLVEKARELFLLSYNNMKVLPQGNHLHHGLLSSFSMDILSSWSDELLFGLVLLLL